MSVSADVGHLTSPVAGDGLVFTTNDLDRVYAFDPATGRTVWSAVVERPEGGYPLPDTLAVAGGKVFATFSNGLYAFPVNCSGRCAPAWHATAPTPDGIMSSAVVDSGLVLVKTWASPTAGHVLAFDPDCRSDGGACEPTWSAIDHGWGDVVAAEGVVYSTSYVDGSVDAFSVTCAQASSCDPVWEAGNLGTPVSGPAYPSARNGLLFVPTEAGVLHVLPSSCPSTCEPVRSFAPNLDARERTRSLSPPLIVGGRMWFVSEDGHLFGYSVGAR
jgi:outer membrane protein assembly factor BamB